MERANNYLLGDIRKKIAVFAFSKAFPFILVIGYFMAGYLTINSRYSASEGLAIVIVMILFSLNWLLWILTKNYKWSSSVFIFLSIVITIYTLSVGTAESMALFWINTIPLTSTVLKEMRSHIYWMIILLAALAFYYLISYFGLYGKFYPLNIIFNSLSSLSFVVAESVFISYLFARYEKEFYETTSDLQMFKNAVASSPNHIVFTDPNGVIVYANKAAQKTTGYSSDEMMGHTPRLWGGLESPEYYQNLWRTIKSLRSTFVGRVRNIRKNKEVYIASIAISPIVRDNVLLGFISSEEDITKKVENDEKTKKRISELEEINELMVNREIQMNELKEEIKKLKNE